MQFNFHIQTHPQMQALMRVLNFFAQVDVLPDRVSTESAGDVVTMSIAVSDLPEKVALIVAEKMRSCPLVISARLTPAACLQSVEE